MRSFSLIYSLAFFLLLLPIPGHAGEQHDASDRQQPFLCGTSHVNDWSGAIAAQIETLNFPFIESRDLQPLMAPGKEVLRKLYRQVKFQPLWLDNPEKARMLVSALKACIRHGLNPDEYFLPELQALSRQNDPRSLARLDVLLTSALLRYGFDLSYGHIALFRANMETFKEIRDFDFSPLTLVKTIYESDDFDKAFDSLAPQHKFYRDLQKRYISALSQDRKQSALAGKIAVNMARWRWYPHKLGQRFVIVNTPEHRLTAWRGDQQVLDMAVITGKKDDPTPLTTGYLRWLEFHPSWVIPPSIAAKEQLPKLRKNPNHLAEKKVRLFSSWEPDAKELDPKRINWHQVTPEQMTKYQLRQDAGPMNALGRIKFIFPNPWSIYLHDTPGKALFKEQTRDLSHGCVRVADPTSLALFLLNGQDADSTRTKIQARLNGDTPYTMAVKRPPPLYLTYQTTWIDEKGELRQASDLYGQDARILALMKK
ncbi:MAG: L,D-transpeptidase family protein [Desulfobulbaceae bacterium]|jgi:murein L,D-transpeptidase YcbB/YkuD|nr:L,D-transpeptidase family protein [Desulfobulbaceae bacterium]